MNAWLIAHCIEVLVVMNVAWLIAIDFLALRLDRATRRGDLLQKQIVFVDAKANAVSEQVAQLATLTRRAVQLQVDAIEATESEASSAPRPALKPKREALQ